MAPTERHLIGMLHHLHHLRRHLSSASGILQGLINQSALCSESKNSKVEGCMNCFTILQWADCTKQVQHLAETFYH